MSRLPTGDAIGVPTAILAAPGRPTGAELTAVPAPGDQTVDTRPADFEATMATLYGPLVRRLVLVLRDTAAAEDVAQEAFLRAYRGWPHFDGRDPRAWLHTIALRLAFNELRRHRRWLAAMRGLVPRPWLDPADPDLWAALGRLDPKTRAAILLNAVDGYTQREVAAMLRVPEGTVASWISRGRATLRLELAEQAEESGRRPG